MVVNGFQRTIYVVGRVMEGFAGVALVFMMSLTTCDVILRAFGRPILGTYEIVGLLGGIIVGFSVPITSWLRGQIFVDFFYQKFPKASQRWLHVCTRIMGILLFLSIGVNLLKMAESLRRAGEVTLTLQLPFYPVCYGIGFAFLVQILVLVTDIVKISRGEYE
jgi:TRAP-type C4-dicarboxylate transport system permease small subunit